LGNICTLSQKNNQVYCNGCKSRWVLTKDTFFYGLWSDKSLVISVLKDLSEGKGQRAIERTSGVGLTTRKRWLLPAAEHVLPINEYLEKQMHLDRVQIDEFWSFILKKREYYTRGTTR
jgi:transposase-like protein